MAELMCNAVGKVMAFPAVGLPAGGPLVDLFAKQYEDGSTSPAPTPCPQPPPLSGRCS